MSLEKMRRKCQQLTDEERMAILQKATAGTLALLGDNDYPYAVPISYAYREGKQYFHMPWQAIRLMPSASVPRLHSASLTKIM